MLIPVRSWACSMTAIFTKSQLDGADSDHIHELEEPGCCARRVAATLAPIRKQLYPNPCSAPGRSEPTQPTHLFREQARSLQCIVPPAWDKDSIGMLHASTAWQALLEAHCLLRALAGMLTCRHAQSLRGLFHYTLSAARVMARGWEARGTTQ